MDLIGAANHFRSRLEYETDVSDVAAALGHWAARGEDPVGRDLGWGEPPAQERASGWVVVDTRSRDAWDAGHLPGAVHVPTVEIPARAAAVAAGASVVVTYCWGPGCNGATRGALAFALAGFPVREMIGGFEYWVREGFAVETAAGRFNPPPDPLTVTCGC
ncbi:MAG: rhodanese-like domain-containing protein [Frankia sp.]